jgi:heterodisulfide reductase subunit C
MGANYKGDGPGILRKIPEATMEELREIFRVTGGMERYQKIEEFSEKKAKELGQEFDSTNDCEYYKKVYKYNSHKHECSR